MRIRAEWLKNNWVIVLTIIWFATGFVLLGTYWAFDWRVLTGFATWFLAGGVGVAIWQIIVQLKATRKSTNAQIAVGLFQELRNEKMVERLRSIYNLKWRTLESLQDPEKEQTEKEEEAAKDIDYVLDRFDTLGVLVANDLVDKQLAIEVYAGVSALRCWRILCKYIEGQRKIRGYYAENYEAFVRLSLDYFEKAHIEPKLYKKEKGRVTETIDLRTELKKNDLHPRSSEEIERDRNKGEA